MSIHLHIGELRRNARQLEDELADVASYSLDDRHDDADVLAVVFELLTQAPDVLLDVPKEVEGE